MLSSALSASKNKYKDSGASIDEAELVAALIPAATKDYLSSINIQKGHLEQDSLPITV